MSDINLLVGLRYDPASARAVSDAIARETRKIEAKAAQASIGDARSAAAAGNVAAVQAALEKAERSARKLADSTLAVAVAQAKLAAASGHVSTLTDALGRADTAAFRLATTADLIGSSFQTRAAALSAFTAAASLGLADAGRRAVEYERRLTRLRVVSDGTAGDVKSVADEIQNLSGRLGVSSTELLRAAERFAAAGFSVEKTRAAIKATAAGLATPNFSGGEGLADTIIAASAAFRLGAADFGKAVGSISQVSQQFSVESVDIEAAIKRVGSAFALVNGETKPGLDNLNELIATFSTLRSVTRESAESLSTALRTISVRLQRAEVIDQLRGLGISLRRTSEEAAALGDPASAGKFVGVTESIKRISGGLRGLSPQDQRYADAVQAIAGTYHSSRAVALINNVDEVNRVLAVAQSGAAGAEAAAAKASDSVGVRLDRIKEQYLALSRTVLDSPLAKLALTGAEGAAALAGAGGGSVLTAGAAAVTLGGFVGLRDRLPSGPTALKYGGALTAAVVAAAAAGQVRESAGGAEDAVRADRERRFLAARGAGGALEGATAGAAGGFLLAGPVGAAAGAAIGAFAGLAQSAITARKDLETARLDIAVSKVVNDLDALSKGLKTVTPVVAGRILDTQKELEKQVDSAAANSADGILGFDTRAFLAKRKALFGANFAPQAGRVASILSDAADRAGERLATGPADPRRRRAELDALLKANGGFVGQQLQYAARNEGQTLAEARQRLERQLLTAELSARSARVGRAGEATSERAAQSVAALVKPVESAGLALSRLAVGVDRAAVVFDGAASSFRFSDRAALITGRAGFDGLAAGLGPLGPDFARRGAAVNDVGRLLPAALAAVRSRPVVEGGDPAGEVAALVERQLAEAGRLSGDARSVLSIVRGRLARELDGEGAADADVSKLAQKALDGASGPLLDAAREIARSLDAAANQFTEGLGRFVELDRRRIDQLREVDVLRAGAARNRITVGLGRRGLDTDRATDLIPLEAADAPLVAQLQRLTRLPADAATNPAALSARLAALRAELPGAERNAELARAGRNPTDPNSEVAFRATVQKRRRAGGRSR